MRVHLRMLNKVRTHSLFLLILHSLEFFVSNKGTAVILEHFNQVIVDCFMDCVNCLIGFANNKSSVDISLKAIALLRISENRLSEVCNHTVL